MEPLSVTELLRRYNQLLAMQGLPPARLQGPELADRADFNGSVITGQIRLHVDNNLRRDLLEVLDTLEIEIDQLHSELARKLKALHDSYKPA